MSVVASAVRVSPSRVLVICGLCLAGSLLLAQLAILLKAASLILPYPFQLDYGEGIVWQQMRNIWRGEAYGPLGVFPAIVYHYPPVFHLVSGALARGLDLDELLAGRLVSLLATLASASLVGSLAAFTLRQSSRSVTLVCAALAGLACFGWSPIVLWAPLMRVDMLACAFSLAGLVLVIRALDRPLWIHAASIAFVIAIYTKQVSIAAPAAAFITLYQVRPVLAWRLTAGCVLLGSAALAILCGLTGGGFVLHVFLYNVNRLDAVRGFKIVELWLVHSWLIVAALPGLWIAWPRCREAWARRTSDRDAVAALLAISYLVLKTLMLPMIMKSGAADNYLIEWCLALTIFIGTGAMPATSLALGTVAPRVRLSPLPIVLALVGLSVEAATAWRWDVDDAKVRVAVQTIQPLVAAIAASNRPVVSDDMTLPIRAGRDVLWEPAIAAELAHSGVYDEAAFVALVRAGAFGFFLTEGRRGDWLFDERYNPPVAAAMEAAYPVEHRSGRFVLHLPPG